jgi:SOS-response transcriptional repressor LexA
MRKRIQIGKLKARRADLSERACMEVEMSPAQREVFLAIDEWWKRFGYSPTVREIAYVTGRSGVSGVHKIVNRLVELGVVKKMEGAGRTIRPVYINFRNLE